jgi:two-component system sensor histidine kinase KdpD
VALLEAGIDVISTLNVQHLESLNDVLQRTLGVTVRETVPDWVLSLADQVVNLDISAEDLRQRLLDGKIYSADKIATALSSFFTTHNLTTLRELALREVASSVDRRRDAVAAGAELAPDRKRRASPRTVDRMLVAMSSHPDFTAVLLRKASRIAGRLNRDWYCVYVQTPAESATRIDAAVQRTLVDNIQRAQGMGAEVVKLTSSDVARAIQEFARDKGVTLVIVGQSRRRWWQHIAARSIVRRLADNHSGLDVLVVSLAPADPS